ncbi:MAG TPA: hypothetical protein VML55_15395 [Planctomycetaceae bacterium]|nr:hypothetical protein [Planctomycetaceae bacterium]
MVGSDEHEVREYFRRDQRTGISPPDLSKDYTVAEHIVRARGKRTQFTSVSLDLSKIRDFGDTDYRLRQEMLVNDGHSLVEHEALLGELMRSAREDEKAERLRAAQALRYAKRRKEGLVKWSFDISGVSRRDLSSWASKKIQPYFSRVK